MVDPKNTKAAVKADAAAPSTNKSIIGSKYRDGRYKATDWLGELIAGVATTFNDKTTKVPVEGEEGAFKEVTTQVADGVNVDKLFKLARENGLDVDKFEDQRAGHGFAGRFRMTVRNMLQARAKRQHGLTVGGKWVSAPADWLTEKDAPAEPTHDQKGAKIAKPKAEKPADAEPAPKADKADAKIAATKAEFDKAKAAKK